MPDYTYLIVGAGMTAAAAIKGIRQMDPQGSIGLIGQEANHPYNRPPLTKGLWKGDKLESIWCEFDQANLTLHLGRTAEKLDPERHQVTDDEGVVYTYKKLLLATGVTPRRFDFGGEEIIYYRTLDDYQRLRTQTEIVDRFAIVGGGFIGSELAAALTIDDKEAILIFPDAGIGSRLFPPDLALFLNDFYRSKGVQVLANAKVLGTEPTGGSVTLHLQNEHLSELVVDRIIAGLGATPNVDLAQAAGLTVENGIRVDHHLQTSAPDIYAAGDVAEIYNSTLGAWRRVEHEDNANSSGKFAGAAMAGKQDKYDYLPFFYSDLFELGYEAVGEVDSRLEMVSDWKNPFREGVVYYLKEGRVRGVLLWNVWEQVEAARRLIAETGPFTAENLIGRLPA